ncbi:ATP-binding protein [Camelimonas sp. ID_303_24]
MRDLSSDLKYARIYMNNLSYDTVTASNWADSFSIVGQIYAGRGYLADALKGGKGQMFGIARLNQSPSYFVASRIEDANDAPLGSVTVKFDAPDMAHYLAGRHITLIVNRQGRVTTASSEPFMLRNVAALLPVSVLLPSDGDEDLGEPMDVRAMGDGSRPGLWLIDGHPYLVRREPLTNAKYQLLTLAALNQLEPMRQQQYLITGLIAAFGLSLILLAGGVAAHLAGRRQRAVQDRILAISQAAERDLTIKVRERTAELAETNASLKAEMDQRRLLEEKLRQSLDAVNDALAQQQEFVAVVSHEFRGPLGVIAVTADNLLSSQKDGPDPVKMRIAKIGRTVRRMSMLIENVLAGDRLNAAHVSVAGTGAFDFNEILHAVRSGLDEAAAARVSVVHGDAAIVKGDRVLLEVVVQNLVQNALKYSAASSPVMVKASTSGGRVFVDVVDQGGGVAPMEQERIFSKYYRVPGQNVSGSGLGLYISREIVRQHGGDLTLAASGVSGSTFRFSLLSGA